MTDEQAAQLQRSRGSTPLFAAMATGTYSHPYRDAGTDAPNDIISTMSNPSIHVMGITETTVAVGTNELPSEDTTDPVLYRETTAVENGAMTLLSKQVAVEAPTTGAKGRAREREVRRRGGRRVIMPSQGLVDAAKAASPPTRAAHVMSPPMLCPPVASPPVIEDHDYSTINAGLSYPALTRGGYLATVQQGARPEETLLCGPEGDRRRASETERDEVEHLSSGDEHGLVIDGKWRSTNTFIAMPADETFSISSAGSKGGRSEKYPVKSPYAEGSTPPRPDEKPPVPERKPFQIESLSEENARLREEIAKLKLEKEELAENARLKEELARLKRGKVELEDYVRRDQMSDKRSGKDDEDGENAGLIHNPFSTGKNICGGYRGDCKGCQNGREELAGSAPGGIRNGESEQEYHEERRNMDLGSPDLSGSDLLWEYGALVMGAHSRRRTANRGNEVGASLMSREVAVEHYAGGKARAREREERGRTHYLTRVLTDSEAEDGDDAGDGGRGRDLKIISEEEYRGRLKQRDENTVAAMANLSEDVRRKYAEDRPSRIWREHSQEILVESDVTGARGRRREVNMRRQQPARFMPSQSMRDAVAAWGGDMKKSP